MTLSGLDFGWGSQDQWKENMLASFSQSLLNWSVEQPTNNNMWTDQDKIWCGDKQFNVNILLLLWNEVMFPRLITAALLTVSKDRNVGIHPYIYEPVLFKLSIMIDTTEIHILLPMWVTLTLFQGMLGAGK